MASIPRDLRCCKKDLRIPIDFVPPSQRISFQQGLTPRLVSGESVRRALKRLGKSWKRAKHWITSPDPQYPTRKKRTRSADLLGQPAEQLGDWFSRRSLVEQVCAPSHSRLASKGSAGAFGRAALEKG